MNNFKNKGAAIKAFFVIIEVREHNNNIIKKYRKYENKVICVSSEQWQLYPTHFLQPAILSTARRHAFIGIVETGIKLYCNSVLVNLSRNPHMHTTSSRDTVWHMSTNLFRRPSPRNYFSRCRLWSVTRCHLWSVTRCRGPSYRVVLDPILYENDYGWI